MTPSRRAERAAGGARPPARRRPRAAAVTDSAAPGFGRIAKALGDPTRVRILELIAEEPEISCGEIVERFSLTQPAISHHLKLLGDAGLVHVRRAGQHGHFRLAPAAVQGFAAELLRRLGLRAAR